MKITTLIIAGTLLFSSTLSMAAQCSLRATSNFSYYKMMYKYNYSRTALHLDLLNKTINEAKGSCKRQELITLAFASASDILARNTNFTAQEKINYLMAYLFEEGMVDILDKNTHPLLNKEGVLGAYSCKENKMWLSADVAPFNLGTVFIHEMSHWARSLAIQHLKNTSKLQDLPATLTNADNYYLYDEALSSIEGAYRQLSFRNDLNRLEDFALPTRENPVYSSFNDLNLYNPSGNLMQLWENSILNEGIDIGTNFRKFFENNFLNQSNKKFSSEIFRLTERVYLNDQSIRSERVLNTIMDTPEALTILNSPLEWLLSLSISQIKQLNDSKNCEFNSRVNPGGEGVGLGDDELNLNHSDLRTCLKPIKDM